ncbi:MULTISPECIES: tryptophan ABC transporter substrate-binding protein [unclassified Streptococcus]|uniref:tryptophan ABC transporter substrate-binding protein n=1 Tax=unclassified Streptococcus TaxID=2608887 RepID=UPI00359E8F58
MKNKRLAFIFGGLLALVVLAVGSQLLRPSSEKHQTDKVKVGVLQFVTHEALDDIYRGIKAGLKESGYTEGSNLQIDFLNSEADQSKVQTMSQTLVNNKNQVLIGIATPAAQGLASATKDIPIVMGAVTDPVGAKLVKDLTAPDGNITGVSDKTPIADQLELMATLTPGVKTVGVLYSSSEDNSKSQVEEFKTLAQAKGYDVIEYAVASSNDITSMTHVMIEKVDAIFLPLDNTVASAFTTVVQAAKEAKTPIYTSVDTMVAEGGLASVFINQYELGVATGKMAAKLLQGEQVAQLPVEVFDQGTPIINETVATELGITIPEQLKKEAQLIK